MHRNPPTSLIQTRAPANYLLDHVMGHMKLTKDCELAKALGASPPQISKMRSAKVGVGPVILVRLNELTGISIKELKALAGLPGAQKYVPIAKDLKTPSSTVPNE